MFRVKVKAKFGKAVPQLPFRRSKSRPCLETINK